jgi:S1-C subfamily serine protease
MQRVLHLTTGATVLLALLANLAFASAQDDIDDEAEERVAAATVLVVASVVEVENGIPVQQYWQRPLGSGVLVSADGYVVTNSHVVDVTALRSDVETEENTQGIDLEIQPDFLIYVVDSTDDDPDPRYSATLITDHPEFDLAVLQITGDEDGRALRRPVGDDRSPVALAPANSVATRDPVHIFGYPAFGNDAFADFAATTIDVIDGRIRSFERGVAGANARLIYIDATVSSGSSGGAVVDDDGQLIGVVSQARSGAAGGSVAVAVPIDRVRAVLTIAGWAEPAPAPELTATLSPTPTAAPSTATPTPTASPTMTPTPAVTLPLTELLPDVLPLAHASCFRVESEGAFTLEELASRFPSSDEAAAQLRDWDWQENAYRAFACDNPPTGEVGYVYISLHRFANSSAAPQAVDYFAASLAEGTTLTYVMAPAVGDYAVALSGPAVNGDEFTLHTSSGGLVIRVTGVSPSGLPVENVVAVAEAIMTAQ